jgi:hypothetical protein
LPVRSYPHVRHCPLGSRDFPYPALSFWCVVRRWTPWSDAMMGDTAATRCLEDMRQRFSLKISEGIVMLARIDESLKAAAPPPKQLPNMTCRVQRELAPARHAAMVPTRHPCRRPPAPTAAAVAVRPAAAAVAPTACPPARVHTPDTARAANSTS